MGRAAVDTVGAGKTEACVCSLISSSLFTLEKITFIYTYLNVSLSCL